MKKQIILSMTGGFFGALVFLTLGAAFVHTLPPGTLNNTLYDASTNHITTGLIINSNTAPAIPVSAMTNGQAQFWCSNASSLLLIKKNQLGNVFTNVLGTAAQ